jgi:hypothetical protein
VRAKALVIRVGHEIFGLVEVRPRGCGGPPVHLEHHLVVSSLREHHRRRYTSQVVLFVIIATQMISVTLPWYYVSGREKQRVGQKIKHVKLASYTSCIVISYHANDNHRHIRNVNCLIVQWRAYLLHEATFLPDIESRPRFTYPESWIRTSPIQPSYPL